MSVQMKILNTLKDLDNDNFSQFCFKLMDPAEEPRFRAGEVKNKSRVEITQLLVSRCRGSGALDRTIKILQEIGCDNEAGELNEN